ncbi:unnamed protein product [Effrenium voratum]|uniref:Ion transport domain-containing protein n=1 Tax=Effrenium voratum TaxID=2562239 RepID=A0AA36ND62_9DINO|nr:unnamed protein product [Effrenium voratum]CAJ1430113.1 unnamed protein product [Effrenium voratum]
MPTPCTKSFEQILSRELQRLETVLRAAHAPSPQRPNAHRGAGFCAAEREESNEVLAYTFDSPRLPDLDVSDRWLDLSIKLLEQDSVESSEATEEWGAGDLQLRGAWTRSWQEVSTMNRSKSFRVTKRYPDRKTRMGQPSASFRDETFLGRLVLEPRSRLQMVWSLLGSLLIGWDMVMVPLELFNLGDSTMDFLTLMSRISFGFWILDMFSNFFFGQEVMGRQELRMLKLGKMYFSSWFGLDVVVISIDLAVFMVEMLQDDPQSAGFRSARFLRTMRLLRLLRLLRAVKLQQELTLLANRLFSAHFFMVAKVLMGLVMMLLINHIIACLWYGIGSWNLDGKSWLVRSQMDQAGFAEAYAVSIHWTLTQFTPATNNVAPDNALERFFAVWVILLAMGVFSSFISSITATVSSLRISRMQQFQQRSRLLRFFCERSLSAELFGKVEEVLHKDGLFEERLQESEVALMSGIPQRLKVQLHEEMFMSSLRRLAIWPSWKSAEDVHFFRSLCHEAMREHPAKPMQDAFMPGTNCEEVYIVEHGRMSYLTRSRTFEVAEGDFLCLPSLWAEWYHRGRLSASTGAAYYVGVVSSIFCQICLEHGGPMWQYLQIFGILLVGEVEAMEEEHAVSDLYHENLEQLGVRAQKFAQILNAKAMLARSFSDEVEKATQVSKLLSLFK